WQALGEGVLAVVQLVQAAAPLDADGFRVLGQLLVYGDHAAFHPGAGGVAGGAFCVEEDSAAADELISHVFLAGGALQDGAYALLAWCSDLVAVPGGVRDACPHFLPGGFTLLPLLLRALARFELAALALCLCGLAAAVGALLLAEAAADGA